MGENKREPRVAAGLCASCTHSREITSDRGSVFLLCEVSFVDAGFPKYPRLPVTQCSGYERKHEYPVR